MTIEQAKELSELLDYRDSLVRELRDVSSCTCIYGTISDGVNGSPFRWSRLTSSVIANKVGAVCLDGATKGLSEEIARIDTIIKTDYVCTKPEEVD